MAKKKSKSTNKRGKKLADAKEQQVVNISDLKEPSAFTVPIWIDRIQYTSRDDGIVIMIFETAIPDQDRRLEVCRLAMTPILAKSISEVIARQIKAAEENAKKGRDI